PLLREETLAGLIRFHQTHKAAVTVLTALMDEPFGYGRVIRGQNGRVQRIVEQKDALPEELEVREINSGIYCMESGFLFANLGEIKSDNSQNEYYLTDLVAMAVQQGETCLAMTTGDADEIMGINDRVQLAAAARILRQRINGGLMLSGVTIIDPDHTYIDHGVTISPDTVIHP